MQLNFIKKFDKVINESVFFEWMKLSQEFLENKDSL